MPFDNWFWGRQFLFHYIFKFPIKASLGPTVPSLGEQQSYQRVFAGIGRGSEQGDEASWNRICWLGSAPTAGNVFPFHSPLKRRRTESVFVQECSNSLRDSPAFLSSLISVWFIYLVRCGTWVQGRGALYVLSRFIFPSWGVLERRLAEVGKVRLFISCRDAPMFSPAEHLTSLWALLQ